MRLAHPGLAAGVDVAPAARGRVPSQVPRTEASRLYDRTADTVTVDEIERIVIRTRMAAPSRWTCSATPCGPLASTTRSTSTTTSPPASATTGRDSTDCLRALRKGDVLVVWKLDRLGRNLAHLVNTVQDLSARGVGLRVLAGDGAQIDTTTAAGRLVFGIFAALAEFERELIRERTVAGLEAARALAAGRAAGPVRDGAPRHVGVRTVPRARHQALRRPAGPVAGIARLEMPSGLGRDAAVEAADRAAGWRPGFAPTLHRAARASVNLTPIAGLGKEHLHRRQGDARLALRAVREAVQPRRTHGMIAPAASRGGFAGSRRGGQGGRPSSGRAVEPSVETAERPGVQ